MKTLVVAMAVSMAALAGGSAAHAAGNGAAKLSPQANSTDISSRDRHRHGGHRPHHWRHHGYYRPHYRNYGYSPRPYRYYGGGAYGYYGGGPGMTFSLGSGGYRY